MQILPYLSVVKAARGLRRLCLAATLVGTSLLAAHQAQAQAPTVITTAPYTINAPGRYQLGADLVVSATSGSIITINSGNVTLDFNGHFISGPSNLAGSNLTGVYANERGNLIIENGTIAFCANGVYLNGNGQPNSLNINQRIQNMLVTYCGQVGIFLSYARNVDVVGNRLSFIGSTNVSSAIGIQFTGTDNSAVCNISDNEIVTVTAALMGIFPITYGINTTAGFVTGNKIANATYGVYGGKYQNTLTINCVQSVNDGTDAGNNN